MKKYFLFCLVALMGQLASNAQIILANPNVSNNRVAEIKQTQPMQVAFRLSPFSSFNTLPATAAEPIGTDLNLTVKEFDLGKNTSGSSFIVPENGIYHFDVNLNFTFPFSDRENFVHFFLMLTRNGSLLEKSMLTNTMEELTPFHTLMISTTIMLNKGDVIRTSYSAFAKEGEHPVTVMTASFSGFKVYSMREDGSAPTGIR